MATNPLDASVTYSEAIEFQKELKEEPDVNYFVHANVDGNVEVDLVEILNVEREGKMESSPILRADEFESYGLEGC